MRKPKAPKPRKVKPFKGWWPDSEKRPGDLWLKPRELTPGVAVANSIGTLTTMLAKTLNPGPYVIKTPDELWRVRQERKERMDAMKKPDITFELTLNRPKKLKKPWWKRFLGL